MPDTTPEVQRLLVQQGLAPADDFVILTRRPQVSFKTQDIEPPSPQLLDLDDTIVVTFYNVTVTPSISVSLRVIRPDGTLFWSQDTVVLPVGQVKSVFTKQVNEGYLINVVVSILGQVVTRGDIYCRVELARSGGPTLLPYAQLCADYVESGQDVSWPVGRVVSPVDGPGKVLVATVPNPGAGVDISFLPTTQIRWQLRSFLFTFTTSAAVGTRFVRLTFVGGGNFVWLSAAPSAGQAPSVSQRYMYTQGTQLATAGSAADTIVSSPLPEPFALSRFFTIRTSTVGLDAADAYTSIDYAVEQWIDPGAP